MNYDSRSTWDPGLDAGSIPARSINKNERNDAFVFVTDQHRKQIKDILFFGMSFFWYVLFFGMSVKVFWFKEI